MKIRLSKKPAEAGNKFSLSLLHVSADLFRLLFNLKDGGEVFLRNVGLSPNYTTLQPRIGHCTYKILVGNFEEEKTLGRHRHKWKANAQIYLEGTESEDMD
jgi:hypothetical protein